MVSKPDGEQRELWLFHMPWAYGVALFLLQTLIHFLVSQSIFAARIETYDEDGILDPEHFVSSVGTSPVAMMCALIAFTILLIVLGNVGRQRIPSSAPVVGTCSAAISAACHPTHRYEGIEHDKLKWGVDRDRHCSLGRSADVTSFPIPGYLYT